jgi:hypothetical protein
LTRKKQPDGITFQCASTIHRLTGGLLKEKPFKSEDEFVTVLESIFPNLPETGERVEIWNNGSVQRVKELTEGQAESLGWEFPPH